MYRLQSIETGKILTAGAFSFLGIFAQISTMLIIAAIFIVTDFILGLIVSKRVRHQGFITAKAYQSMWKLLLVEAAIILSHLLDTVIMPLVNLHLPVIAAGIFCGIEFWSILSNSAILSNYKGFKYVQKWAKSEIEHKLSALKDFDKDIENK